MERNEMEFENKHVLVIGGTSGIGMALVRGFLGEGASVTGFGSNRQKVERLQADADVSAVDWRVVDVRERAALRREIDSMDRLDVLVNCQGMARAEREWESEIFDDVMEVNLASAFVSATAAFPMLKESRGCIINLASMLSYLGDAYVPAYVTSKTGVVGLTRALAHRYGPHGVRVNALAPGYHKTDLNRRLWETDNPKRDEIARRAALKRWGETADLVGPALFLASNLRAGFVTGAILPVDGGYHTG